MQMFDLERARGSLGRGLARQAFEKAQRDDADFGRALRDLHDLAPNPRSRSRFARRLGRRPGVVAVSAGRDGVTAVLRSTLTATVREPGAVPYEEPRIAWLRIRAVARRRAIGFDLHCAQLSLHAMHRRVERSGVDLSDLLGRLDTALLRALGFLARNAPVRDRDDAYLPAIEGVWAGREETMASDPAWGAAFRHAPKVCVFSVRTFLGEDQMRPTVWLKWSQRAA